MSNIYCINCKNEGIVKLAESMSVIGPLCSKHNLKFQKELLENFKKSKEELTNNNSNNIYNFKKIAIIK